MPKISNLKKSKLKLEEISGKRFRSLIIKLVIREITSDYINSL